MTSLYYGFLDNNFSDELDIIDHHDHLSEIEYYPLSDAEIGVMNYYEALGENLAEEKTISSK